MKAGIQRFAYVDVLRGFAVLGVIMVHVGMYAPKSMLPPILAYFFGYGIYGVQLFFFASAFTLFYSMNSRNKVEYRPSLNFFIRRFARIAPLYYIALLFYLWLYGTQPNYYTEGKPITFVPILYNILFVHSFSPTAINTVVPGGWSIGCEMLFYCFVPLLYKLIKSLNHAIVFFFLSLIVRAIANILMANILRPVLSDHLLKDFLYYYLPNQLPVFAIGIIFYFLTTVDSKFGRQTIILAVSALILDAMLTIYLDKAPNIKITYVFLLFALSIKKLPMTGWIPRAIISIGKVSYSIYLVHFGVLYFMRLYLVKDRSDWMGQFYQLMIVFALTLLISWLISLLTYKFIELKGQILGKYLIDKSENKASKAQLQPNIDII